MLTDNPLLMLDRWLSILRYGRGEVFVMPSAAAVQAALRKLKRYGVKTYAFKLHANGTREFRVRSEQAEWARYLLAGNEPPAWADKNRGRRRVRSALPGWSWTSFSGSNPRGLCSNCMSCDDCNELTPQQRAGLVIWLMARGHSFTTMEIAHIVGLEYRGAKHMMDNLSGKLPIHFEHSRWKLLTDN